MLYTSLTMILTDIVSLQAGQTLLFCQCDNGLHHLYKRHRYECVFDYLKEL